MSAPSSNSKGPPPARLFDPLEQGDFIRLEHAASLKGLLKPFTGKGDLTDWGSQCESLRDGLMRLAQRIVSQATAYPFSRLPTLLAQQTTSAGTAFLRWRNADRSAMGVLLWAELISNPLTPPALVHELFALERERIVLNMQISLTHSIARQAKACADKMARAESLYQRRVNRHAGTPHRGVPQ